MATDSRAPEQRTIDVDVQNIDTRGRTLVGYAAVYGAVSDDLGGFKERIAPGAFANVLDADVRALLNHDPSQVLGRTRSGTLRLTDERRGLRFEVDLPDSPLGENVREAVRRGDIDGASFRFQVDKETWDGDLRTVEAVKDLKDITVATFGAYPAASVELRTRPNTDTATQAKEGTTMAAEAETKQDTTEQVEERTERMPAGSLRVNEREDIRATGLADLYEQRGFFTAGAASVTWDEYRSFTWAAGTVLTDLNPVRREGVPFGYDTRWLYPVLPTTAVSDSTTAVQYLRQSARSLAGTAVIRPLDSTTTKPETSTTVEFQTLQLSQVATVSSGIPRIMSAQPMFQSLVEQDLRLSIGDGLDEVVRRGISTAGTSAAVTGTDVLQKVRKGVTVIQSNGYSPNVLAIDPAGAEALDLLQTAGSEKFYVWGPGRAAPTGPFGLTMRVWKNAGTALLDADAFGRLYVSPMELRSFEADGGLTNKQNVRLETNAGYAVERVPAGLRII
jgi:HK97 family phage prohead protease